MTAFWINYRVLKTSSELTGSFHTRARVSFHAEIGASRRSQASKRIQGQHLLSCKVIK